MDYMFSTLLIPKKQLLVFRMVEVFQFLRAFWSHKTMFLIVNEGKEIFCWRQLDSIQKDRQYPEDNNMF